eukprot:Skav209108  [mRNA]  locus=scaffold179:175695:178202:- [translate_table: standard]
MYRVDVRIYIVAQQQLSHLRMAADGCDVQRCQVATTFMPLLDRRFGAVYHSLNSWKGALPAGDVKSTSGTISTSQ